MVQMLGRNIQQKPVAVTDESDVLFYVVVDYTDALDTLDSYSRTVTNITIRK